MAATAARLRVRLHQAERDNASLRHQLQEARDELQQCRRQLEACTRQLQQLQVRLGQQQRVTTAPLLSALAGTPLHSWRTASFSPFPSGIFALGWALVNSPRFPEAFVKGMLDLVAQLFGTTAPTLPMLKRFNPLVKPRQAEIETSRVCWVRASR